MRRTAAGLGHADVIQLTLSLLQAASVVSPLINSDPMCTAVDQAVEDLGLEGVQLLATRVK